MTTQFDPLDALLSTTVNAMFGERFQIVAFTRPVGDVDGAPVRDMTKPILEVVAEYVAQSMSTPLPARGAMQDDNAHNYTAAHPQIHVDDAYLTWLPVAGCRVVRVATGEVWQIQKPPRPDGFGHTCIPLTNKMRSVG